ncbi:TetR/AcrR family transcriptional regulator [Alteribacillus iranensis]|uniref:DNA-binding transcriptional regulator, AcrR family n=1 Tax=Alteribacillus iranensis TaxID=930128 RepID=A0A1I2CPF8_9BACI|nr:TetR/AcrR family transcriptional regulator [Alteribacillus iranensis]SFE70138.1 DNA-binding transcriptional regulator, AcrR family [Alteribacillus iranensis]
MAAQEIKKYALALFIEKGFEGASLTDIGNKVGIKKQSIYFHYKNKDDLFLQIVKGTVMEELESLNRFFEDSSTDKSLHDHLLHYIYHVKNRYEDPDDKKIKFLIRVMFSPPHHLKDTVMSYIMIFYRRLEQIVLSLYRNHEEEIRVDAEDGALSFMNFIDGLMTELVYVNSQSFQKRLSVCWDIYWWGIKKCNEGTSQ